MTEKKSVDRRTQNSDATRQAIRRAARGLFARRGYAATRVEDIAHEAQVSPATVYGSVGGKAGLLEFWMDAWTDAPALHAVYAEIAEATSSQSVVEIAVNSVRATREAWGDVIRFVREASAEDPRAARALEVATQRYRDAVMLVARRLADLGAVDGRTAQLEFTAQALWFYLGYRCFDVLVGENGWSFDQAAAWLQAQILKTIIVQPDKGALTAR